VKERERERHDDRGIEQAPDAEPVSSERARQALDNYYERQRQRGYVRPGSIEEEQAIALMNERAAEEGRRPQGVQTRSIEEWLRGKQRRRN
jgi:hypothetical protein